MQLAKILFSTDFSHSGDAALSWATSLARDTGAKLHIVHVEEPPVAYGGGEWYYGVPEPDTAELQRMLAEIVPGDPDVPHEHHLILGTPAKSIVRFAEENGVDLIVMGTHGRSGLPRLLMGSVAEEVVRGAHCPVLTLREPEKKTE